jgi:hypothetical protein
MVFNSVSLYSYLFEPSSATEGYLRGCLKTKTQPSSAFGFLFASLREIAVLAGGAKIRRKALEG